MLVITRGNDGAVDLQQLRYLDALAAERHFGRAAARCHVSQPALSSALRRLEQEVGLRLVHRAQRFEGLTEEGEALLPWARATLAAADALESEAASLRGDLGGTARIAAIPTVANSIGRLLMPFVQAHPGVRVELSTERADLILEAVARRELDAGLLYVDDPLPPALRTVPLYRDELVLLTSDPAVRESGAPISWRAASELPLCLLAPELQNRQLIDRAFARAGAPQIAPRVETDSVAALVNLGFEGSSCIVARAWIVDRHLPRGVSARSLVDPVVAPMVGLVTAAGPLTPPRARALAAALAGANSG